MKQDQLKEFDELVRPLMKYLAEKQHPHTVLLITPTSAQLMEGICGTATEEYLKD